MNLKEPSRGAVSLPVLGFMLVALNPLQSLAEDPTSLPSFSSEIQPILARACFSCHGGVKQAADLSFVKSQSVLPPEGWVVEPGDADASEMFDRISSTDPDLRMPPPDEHPDPLTPDEVELIRRWIDGGAPWDDQWSRTPLLRDTNLSSPESMQWAKESLDHLVFEQLDSRGFTPSAEAEPAAWLRRCSLDLIGLPPTKEELLDFLKRVSSATTSGDRDLVYAAEVNRLLSSAHFGERWAAVWMDLARYADSKGFEKDPHRDIWPYRDWLIKSFNEDLPYDQFTIKQLAGDLLPEASFDDRVATAFHRNTQTNTEGGTDDEEFRMAAVIDRVNTTWTVWQATTFGCVQCHAHPYEPFENRDYYASLALFNNTEDSDLDSDHPTLPYVQDAEQQRQWTELSATKRTLQAELDTRWKGVIQTVAWQKLPLTEIRSSTGELAEVNDELRIVAGTVSVGCKYSLTSDCQRLTALRIEILPESDDVTQWPEQGAVISQLKLARRDSTGASHAIDINKVVPDYRTGSYDYDEMLKSSNAGFGGYPKLFGPRWVVAVLDRSIEIAPDEQLIVEIEQKSTVTGGRSNHLRRFKLSVTDDDSLIALYADAKVQERTSQLEVVRTALTKIKGPALPVMHERDDGGRRETRQFIRGNWLERGEVVEPGIPDVFQTQPRKIQINNRLEFAQWLVSRQNPLAARVWVNRVWAQLFGVGIVETVEDFGVSGQFPSNRGLLDHLAGRMRDDFQWSLKQLLSTIVLSATYRQSSTASAELRELDPRNRWLARGPRTRLTAEMVRDQALVASGKLTSKVGGPSVMPPQPEGVWQQAYSNAQWKEAEGQDRYRRGLYTYWRRTSPYPGFLMFDTPTRDVCSPRRIATNTPLQALVTLNSRVFVELADALARRVSQETQGDIAAAIEDMFLRVTTQRPREADLADLHLLHDSIVELREREAKAERPPSPLTSKLSAERLDPLAMVALAILNTDWALTK